MKKGQAVLWCGVCIACVALLLVVFMWRVPEEEFIVRPYEQESYYQITDEVVADAAIVYNITKREVVAGKNITKLKSIASITKLTAALLAYPRINETDVTVLDSIDFVYESNTPLRLGDVWQTIRLLEYSLITSSNRGISAVGRTIEEKTGESLVDLMNEFAKKEGLVQTHFLNSTGLDAHAALAGSESSALDLAKVAEIIVTTRSDLAEKTVRKSGVFYSNDRVRYEAENTNTLIGTIPDRILLSKTGYTHIAGGTLIMVVERFGERFAFVVLDSTRFGRFEDMKRLLLLHREIKPENSVH